jgi:hypothetical protein
VREKKRNFIDLKESLLCNSEIWVYLSFGFLVIFSLLFL